MFKEIDEACPQCGEVGVWMCSLPSCPMKDAQKQVRKTWQERNGGNEEDKSSQNQ